MARLASNPLTLPRFRPHFQVSDSSQLFKSPFLSPNRISKFQAIACQTNPTPTETEPSNKEKVLAEPDSVKDSPCQATTSSVGGGFSEFPNKSINRRIAVGSTLAAVGLFLSSRLDFGISLKDLSAAAVPYEEFLFLNFSTQLI
ncbi:hypothetical protein CRYUN_Cryun04dG0173100 [Craigia yunnanensis]